MCRPIRLTIFVGLPKNLWRLILGRLFTRVLKVLLICAIFIVICIPLYRKQFFDPISYLQETQVMKVEEMGSLCMSKWSLLSTKLLMNVCDEPALA